MDPLSQDVLERLVHSSGEPSLAALLQFSPGACDAGLQALKAGALILTDTAMAAAARTWDPREQKSYMCPSLVDRKTVRGDWRKK